MKSIFAIATILVLLAIFFLIYWDQVTNPAVPETPIFPGISPFRGPSSGPPGSQITAPTETFSPPPFTGPLANPRIIGPKGPPPNQ